MQTKYILKFLIFQILLLNTYAKKKANCFLINRVAFSVICNDLSSNINQVLDFNNSKNLSLYNRILFNNFFKKQILHEKNLISVLNYLDAVNIKTVILSYTFIRGININLFQNKSSKSISITLVIYDSVTDIYSNGSFDSECNKLEQSTNYFVINSFIFSVRNPYKRKICPLLFQNTNVPNFFIFALADTFYKKNVINFEKSPFFNNIVNSLYIKNTENVILDENILNQNLFYNVEYVVLGGKFNRIQPNTFVNFTKLKLIRLDIYFARNLLLKGFDWIRKINDNIKVKLEDRNQVLKFLNRSITIDIHHPDLATKDFLQTADKIFPDEDFCLYVNFPFDQLIRLSVSDGIDRNFKFNFTCTYHFIRKKNRLSLDYFLILYFKESILYDFENISHCNFDQLSKNCDSKIFQLDFDYQNFRQYIIIFDFITLIVINPIICIIGLMFTSLIVFFLTKNDLKPPHYQFFITYSILCFIYFFLTLSSLVNECPFHNGIFCSKLWTLKYAQLYKIIVLNFINGTIKFMINSIIIGFTYSRFLVIKQSPESKLAKKINFRNCFITSLIIGFGLNVLNFIFVIPNYIEPFANYPFNLIEDDLIFKSNIGIILKYLNLFYEIATNFLLFIINIVIDWILCLNFRKVVKKNIHLKKMLNVNSKISKLKNSDLRHFKITLFISIINTFFKLFQTLPVVYSFLHFFSLTNSQTIKTLFDSFIVKICFKFNLDILIKHLCYFSFSFSLLLNIFFYFLLDQNIQRYFAQFWKSRF